MNEVLIYYMLPVMGSIFIVYAQFYAMKQIGMNREIAAWKRELWTWGYIVVMIFVSLLGNVFLNFLLLLMIPVFGYFLYNDSKIYVAYYLGMVIIIFLADAVITFVFQMLVSIGVIYFLRAESYYVLMIIGMRLLEWMVIKIVTVIVCKKEKQSLTNRQMLATCLLPLASIVILFTMLILVDIYPSVQNMVYIVVDVLILLGINIYVTSIIDTMSRNNQLQNELMLYQQQEQFQKSYYENLEQKYQNTRKLVHDIRNHIQMMELLYEEQKNEKGLEYVEDIHDILNQLGQKYYTSNKMLNMILNDKVSQMEAKGIQVQVKITDCPLNFIRDMDLTIIFGNLLDNAIAAAGNSETSKERRIRINIMKIHEFISVTLENTADKEPIVREEKLISNKKGHEALGIKNVERAVKKYKGEIAYEWNDGIFTTRLMFAV